MTSELQDDGKITEKGSAASRVRRKLALSFLGLALLCFVMFHTLPAVWILKEQAGGGEAWQPWFGYQIWQDVASVVQNPGQRDLWLAVPLILGWIIETVVVVLAPFVVSKLAWNKLWWRVFAIGALLGISSMLVQYSVIPAVEAISPEELRARVGAGMPFFVLFPILNLLGIVLLWKTWREKSI